MEDASTIGGGTLGGAGAAAGSARLGVAGLLAGTPSLANAITRAASQALCRFSARSYCSTRKCCESRAY